MAKDDKNDNKDSNKRTDRTNAGDTDNDRHPTPVDAAARDEQADPNRTEELGREAAEKRSREGGDVKQVEKDGVTSYVATPLEDQSDNGKTYKDPRIVPSDTNAPDAGVTPDGRTIAK